MDRRETLKMIAALTGGALNLSIVTTLISGCETAGDAPPVLNREQDDLLQLLTELIIPTTDTPGAGAVGVNRFIGHLLADWYTAVEKDIFLKGLADLEFRANEQFGMSFLRLDTAEQNSMLEVLESESNNVWSSRVSGELPSFFAMVKVTTLIGYYASEIGAAEELRTNVVPGSYQGCIPYEEIGRSWSDN